MKKLLRFLIPDVSPATYGRIVLVLPVGALVAGLYGMLHDQVTYTISQEYFTRFKFFQFAYAKPDHDSPRLFAAIIGFLATWWVGALVAWIIARVSVMQGRRLPAFTEFLKAFTLVFGTSLVIALLGWGYGLWRRSTGYAIGWLEWMDAMAIQDREAFMTVGYIHNSSYLGGIIGTFVAIYYLRTRSQQSPRALANTRIRR